MSAAVLLWKAISGSTFILRNCTAQLRGWGLSPGAFWRHKSRHKVAACWLLRILMLLAKDPPPPHNTSYSTNLWCWRRLGMLHPECSRSVTIVTSVGTPQPVPHLSWCNRCYSVHSLLWLMYELLLKMLYQEQYKFSLSYIFLSISPEWVGKTCLYMDETQERTRFMVSWKWIECLVNAYRRRQTREFSRGNAQSETDCDVASSNLFHIYRITVLVNILSSVESSSFFSVFLIFNRHLIHILFEKGE
jgi:hypothetical protein